jgi:hypothetical protein
VVIPEVETYYVTFLREVLVVVDVPIEDLDEVYLLVLAQLEVLVLQLGARLHKEDVALLAPVRLQLEEKPT